MDERPALWAAVAVLFGFVGAGCGGTGADPTATLPLTAPDGSVVFSGRIWEVKVSDTPVGPGPNRFGSEAAANVTVDQEGRLHLRITRRDGQWYSAEVIGTDETGYGTYTWELDASATPLEPNAVLGLFTWSDLPEFNHREIDIELSRFRRPTENIAGQYIVQPHARMENLLQFVWTSTDAPTVSFTWLPGEVRFAASGADPSSWTYSGPDVPKPGGGVHPRMNLWLLAGDAPAIGEDVEIIVRRFTYEPART